jgi:hypothetical protein
MSASATMRRPAMQHRFRPPWTPEGLPYAVYGDGKILWVVAADTGALS